LIQVKGGMVRLNLDPDQAHIVPPQLLSMTGSIIRARMLTPKDPVRGKSLGIAACTAIVVGNMVGSGFYLSPAAVAPYGTLAIVVWALMGIGAICLGLTFCKLARLRPETGGPYAYTRIAYGDFPGFLIAWVYWISIWASLPVIAIALAGAVMDMVPGLQSRVMATMLTVGAIWVVVFINLRGVKEAGFFAELMTYSKLIPFGAVAILGLLYINPSHFSVFNASGKPLLSATAALAPLTMFAYLGLESATVPAGDVKNPERTIPRSTILGIVIAMLLYILGTIAVMGVVPGEQLVKSVAPFSDAARIMWGPWGATAISIAVILSAIGALNGWTLLMGQVPMAAARDGLFPPIFSRMSEQGVPATGVIISATLSTVLILIQAAGESGFQTFYSLVVGLSTMAAVIPYAFCAMATGLVAAHGGSGIVPRITIVEIIAFVFAIFTLYGCGAEAVLYGVLLLMLGIPIYVWQRRQASERKPASEVEPARA
jgi:basic amino acid/polyamine antiporter, APA family